MSKVLEVRKVTVRFGGVVAVQDASLTINDGELIGFIGPNGAGKTTLMRVVTGIVKPTEGDVLLLGRDITGWPINVRVQAGLAFAQQIVQPLAGMTLLDNVALACGSGKTRNPLLAMVRTDRGPERARARELLGLVGLGDVVDHFPGTMPLGVRKRLEMARAMALDPKLLLLDEPLAGLNQAEAHSLADLIRDLNARGQTILLIEHNLREVMRICPTLYVQDRGRPLAFGGAAEVMADPAVRQAYLGGHA
ncbi:ABC transporter ATP-binding protein [Mesorhizobium sp. INR15]|uniref:ABC transporter ATP-binding protein n=1 Tax=Mesorhizobium sp. INR15 TaxID=2654248 RepID=UPI001896A0A8|nr:ABC transporter ATP-binding protein [Mesorhizobium sp. INR15]QPC94571.1 ATP-binding cassette domain-containing protein [Mesorhizobium sp. INR15]